MIYKVRMTTHGILLLWIVIFTIGSSSLSFAQKYEIGAGVGVLSYTGDISRKIFINALKPAGVVLYRLNMNDHLSIRVSLLGGGLSATDNPNPIDAFAKQRASSFNISIYELSTGFEYYFLDFNSKRLINYSPYFYTGAGLFAILGNQNKVANYSNVQVAIPLTFGVKYKSSPKWTFSAEASVRATLFDYLDNISEGDIFTKDYQYGNPWDYDVYYYAGISLSYAFYAVDCPTLPIKQGYRN